MYNTPDKHHTNQGDRSKIDFSDIDNLDRATEVFMKGQRKALGRRAVNLDAVAEQGKRALVFIVLGAIFVTALVAGVRFAYNDDPLRDPNQSVSDEVVASGTNQTTDGSSSDLPKDEANGSATTATTTAEEHSSVTTEPTTYEEDPAISTTLPQLSETEESLQTTTTTSKATVTTTSTTGTGKTTTPKRTTTTTTPRVTTTTKKTSTTTTTTTTGTTRRSTTTTSVTTTATTTKKTTTSTTTTTTTTTPAPAAHVDVARTGVISSQKAANGTYRSVVEVYLKNYGDATANSAAVTVSVTPSSAITYAVSMTGGWNVSVNGGNAYVTTRQAIAPGETVCVQISIVTASVVTGCNVIG